MRLGLLFWGASPVARPEPMGGPMSKGIPGHNRRPRPEPAPERVCTGCGRVVPEGEKLVIEASTDRRTPASKLCSTCDVARPAEGAASS